MLDRLTRGIIILSLITFPQGYTSPSFAIERDKEDLKVTTKEEGYKKSIELSKKYNLYRQDYCGCKYSVRKETQEKNNYS